MIDRNDDQIGRRKSVLERDRDALGTPAADMLFPRGARGSDRRILHRFIPILFFAAILLLIGYNEVPAVRDTWDRTFTPQQWSARQVCAKTALQRAPNSAFARVIERGNVHPTNEGLYIDGLVLGEMGEAGSEIRVEYTCYLNAAGELVSLTRTPIGSAPVGVHPQVPAHTDE